MRTSVTHKELQTYTFPMTDGDVLERVDEVNELHSQETNLNTKKQLIQKEMKQLQADQMFKLSCIARREEPREVECVVVFDYENRSVETTYEGEVMNSRKMSEWEFSCRPEDIYPETHKNKVSKATVTTSEERAEEIATKEGNNQFKSADVNAFSEAKTETAVEGLSV